MILTIIYYRTGKSFMTKRTGIQLCYSLKKRLFVEKAGSQVRVICSFRRPASSPGVGIWVR
jgi:hypothetical protein